VTGPIEARTSSDTPDSAGRIIIVSPVLLATYSADRRRIATRHVITRWALCRGAYRESKTDADVWLCRVGWKPMRSAQEKT
jgi:hypothetical protein